MPLSTPVVFPLFGIDTSNGEPRCACGAPTCARIGKHPAVSWGDISEGDAVPRPEPGAGVGLKTGARPRGSGVIVVDIDSAEAWDALSACYGTLPDTLEVETGRGWQLYFQHPGFPVRNSASELVQGVDIRGDGGFVVAPGSPHRNGKTYTIVHDVEPAPCPPWLLAWLQERPAAVETQTYPGDVQPGTPEHAHRRALYTKYLKHDAPARGPERRGKGDATLFDVVQRGAYDLQLPVDDVLELVREHYDPRCSPMWGDELEERVLHKAKDAKTRSTRPRAEPIPADLASLVLEMPPAPPDEPRIGADGKPKQKGILWGAWDEDVPPPVYLVAGLIPVETVGMFVAMGSSLKTWTALDVARAVAKGEPWLGLFNTMQGRALVVDFESGAYELRRRIRLLEGDATPLPTLGAWAYPEGVRIDDVAFWTELAKIPDLKLVVIDSLAAGAPGGDENDANIALPLKMAARWTEVSGGVALFIHHSRKDESDDRKMVRGSTAIYADLDWAFKFDPVEETATYRRMQMVCIKPSMGPKPPPVPLELTDDGLTTFSSGEAKPMAGATDEEVQRAILLALSNGAIETKHKVAKALGMRPDRVGPELDALVTRREVAHVKGMGYVLDSPSARQKRVCALVEGYDMWRSEGAIAKAAGVDTEVVSELVRKGVLTKSADGRWLVPNRSEVE